MLHIDVPGWKTLRLAHLFLDYNGTLALDGRILPGVAERLPSLERAVTEGRTPPAAAARELLEVFLGR